MHNLDSCSFNEFIDKFGDITGETWEIRESDGLLYRMLYIEPLSESTPLIYVSHELDDLMLEELYASRDTLRVVFKYDSNYAAGKVIVHREKWEPIDLFGDFETGKTDVTRTENRFKQTKKEFDDVQELIKKALYYFMKEALYSKLFYSHVPKYFEFNNVHTTPALALYEKYLNITDYNLSQGSLESTEETYKKTIGTIRNSLEVAYFFYVLSVHVDYELITMDAVYSLGKQLSYSNSEIDAFISKISYIVNTPPSKLEKELLPFKESIIFPYKRIPPHSKMQNVKSVESYSTGSRHSYNTNSYEYETMDYWNISDESYRDALDDDPEAYWNID